MLMNTVIITSNTENTSTTYHFTTYSAACDFTRELRCELEGVGWVEGEDYTIAFGDDIEVEDTEMLTYVRAGMYKREYFIA